MSAATHLIRCVLTIKVDTWNETRSSLQCAFLSHSIITGTDLNALADSVYYRLYTKDGPLESNSPIYSNDNFISRIVSSSVRPPQTAASLMRYLCKIEGLALQNCILFQALSEMTALDDSIRLSLEGTTGQGTSDEDPMALVVHNRAVERRSQVTSTAPPQDLLDRDFEQRYGAALLCVTRKSSSRIFSVLLRLRR